MKVVSRSKPLQVALMIAATIAFASVFFLPTFKFLPIAVAVLCLMLVATSLSKAGHFAIDLQSFEGRSVRVGVWGTPIRDGDSTALHIESITAFSAALLIFVRSASGKRILLKIAQPTTAEIGAQKADITDARYVSWGGKKLPNAVGLPAVTMSTLTS